MSLNLLLTLFLVNLLGFGLLFLPVYMQRDFRLFMESVMGGFDIGCRRWFCGCYLLLVGAGTCLLSIVVTLT